MYLEVLNMFSPDIPLTAPIVVTTLIILWWWLRRRRKAAASKPVPTPK